MNWIIDLVVLALIVLAVVKAYKKGFLRSVLSLGGFLLAFIVSFTLGRALSEGIFDAMVRPWLTSTVETQVVAGTNESLTAAVNNMYENLPGFLSGPLDFLFGSKDQMIANIQSTMNANSFGLTESIVEILKPMMVALIGILVIIVLMILCMIVLKIIDRVLIRVRHLPLIGTCDGILGAIVGVFQAILWMVFLVFLVKAVILLSSNGISWLNDSVIESTTLFRWLYHFDLTQAFAGLGL